MENYVTIQEIAGKWNLSPRRVQYLCKTDRIPGAQKTGDIWLIPADASKPADMRIKKAVKEPAFPTDDLDIETLYGPDTRQIQERHVCSIYQTRHGNGTGIITKYDVFPGIQLFYQDFHLDSLDYSRTDQDFSKNVITINHCRLGRFEAEFANGEFIYLGEGDLAMNLPEKAPVRNAFPLSHFHGVTITISIEEAAKGMKELETVFGEIPVHFEALRDRLLKGNEFIIFRSSPALEHILGEMYEEQKRTRLFYLKLKVLELFFYLLSSNQEAADDRPYFNKNHVLAVKAMTDYMVKNINRHFTSEELSLKFGIPLTSMKKCFKGIYGMPVHTYMREYRVHVAADLLRQTNLSIAEIAEQVGYSNQSKFTETFRRILNVSPVEYRNNRCPDGRKKDFSD
ncbi:MAG: AraC family transcriptional regulator [Eubacteriales bacterium]|nr:AraC family transcriptional regulator [Eubacteriales bacterium]